MTNLLLRLFVKNYKSTSNSVTRDKAIKLSSVTCILLNVLLAVAKIVTGVLFGLVSVFADGMNNLTDCGSNAVSLVSVKLSGKPADKEHPFGHKRIEYVASMVVAFVVLVLAFELATESVSEIVAVFKGTDNGEVFSWWAVVALSVSALVKLWMFVFNLKLSKRYNSQLLKATAIDSISDVCATTAVLLSVFVAKWTGLNVDGFMGVAVAIVIAVAGVKILKGAFSSLIGEAPGEQFVDEIVATIKKFDGIICVHDLAVHNYGPNRYYASVHVEVNANLSLLQGHEIIDNIERYFAENTDIKLVIHLDPTVVGDTELDGYKGAVVQVVKLLDEHFDVHDFRMIKGANRINLVFDVAVHYDTAMSDADICNYIQKEISQLYPTVYVTPTVERQLK